MQYSVKAERRYENFFFTFQRKNLQFNLRSEIAMRLFCERNIQIPSILVEYKISRHLYCKVRIFLESHDIMRRPENSKKLWNYLGASNQSRFFKFLLPSQNIWTLIFHLNLTFTNFVSLEKLNYQQKPGTLESGINIPLPY